MRYVAGQPVEQIFPGSAKQLGQGLPPGAPLPTTEFLRVMVWNIFKQQRAQWLSVLKEFGRDAQTDATARSTNNTRVGEVCYVSLSGG